MTQEKIRQAFESHYSNDRMEPRAIERYGNGYKLMQAQVAWETWQAAWNAAQLAAPVLTECRHCGFRVALNESPQGAGQ